MRDYLPTILVTILVSIIIIIPISFIVKYDNQKSNELFINHSTKIINKNFKYLETVVEKTGNIKETVIYFLSEDSIYLIKVYDTKRQNYITICCNDIDLEIRHHSYKKYINITKNIINHVTKNNTDKFVFNNLVLTENKINTELTNFKTQKIDKNNKLFLSHYEKIIKNLYS